MLYKVKSNTFCTNGNEITELFKGETIQIEKRTNLKNELIIKVYQDIFIGIIDDNDAVELDL